MSRSAATLLLALLPSLAPAWSPCGHHVIALIAYDLLDGPQQAALVQRMKQHPRFGEDFDPPASVNNRLRHQIGFLGNWADTVRSLPEYGRPKWHYHLGATLVVGDRDRCEVPAERDPLPPADLSTEEMHLRQALATCGKIAGDASEPAADRALALAWLAHLVADSHQPCHTGSLYAAGVLAEGDRGGNEIKLRNGRNLHALWDGLMGRRYDENRVRREVLEILSDQELVAAASSRAQGEPLANVSQWLLEGQRLGREHVYTNEVLAPVRAVSEGRTESLPEIRVSEEYLQRAGRVARLQACTAGHRLARVWGQVLHRE